MWNAMSSQIMTLNESPGVIHSGYESVTQSRLVPLSPLGYFQSWFAIRHSGLIVFGQQCSASDLQHFHPPAADTVIRAPGLTCVLAERGVNYTLFIEASTPPYITRGGQVRVRSGHFGVGCCL